MSVCATLKKRYGQSSGFLGLATIASIFLYNIMVTDLLLSWPRNCDYPKWRQFLRDNRARFNEVLIAFTETNQGHDYRDFIKQAMFSDYVQFGDAPQPKPGEDWRNLAINAMLLHSYNAPWVWFTEQDFYPGEGFWDNVQRLEDEGCGVIAVYQADRMHPCCIFMNRDTLNRTRKDFGIIPDKADHFSKIQQDIDALGIKVGKINTATYYHHNGLSHNMTLLARGERPNYEVGKFTEWLGECMKVSVPVDERFVELAARMGNMRE